MKQILYNLNTSRPIRNTGHSPRAASAPVKRFFPGDAKNFARFENTAAGYFITPVRLYGKVCGFTTNVTVPLPGLIVFLRVRLLEQNQRFQILAPQVGLGQKFFRFRP